MEIWKKMWVGVFSEHSVEGITEPVSDRGEGDRKRVYNTENKLQISQE